MTEGPAGISTEQWEEMLREAERLRQERVLAYAQQQFRAELEQTIDDPYWIESEPGGMLDWIVIQSALAIDLRLDFMGLIRSSGFEHERKRFIEMMEAACSPNRQVKP